MRCPLQYKFRYIDGLIIPPNSEICLGKSIHRTLEENYSQKIQTRQDLPLEHITDLFSDFWDEESKEAVFEADEKPGKVKDDGINLVRVYHRQVAPSLQPVYVEKEFYLPIEGSDYFLKGYIDLIEEQGVIIDHKTTKRAYPQDKAKNDLQLTAYALAYRMLFGMQESGVRFDVLVRTKTPKIQHLTSKRTNEDILRFLKILREVEKGIREGIFYPNENFMCSVCGYKDLCKKW